MWSSLGAGLVLPCREPGFPELERLRLLEGFRSLRLRGCWWGPYPLRQGWGEMPGIRNTSVMPLGPTGARRGLRLSSLPSTRGSCCSCADIEFLLVAFVKLGVAVALSANGVARVGGLGNPRNFVWAMAKSGKGTGSRVGAGQETR